MKSILTAIFATLILVSCSEGTKKGQLTVMRQPAEFEAQEAIWLMWPPGDHKEGESVKAVTLGIIEALLKDQNVVVTCGSDVWCKDAKEVLANYLKKSKNLTVQAIPSLYIWTRDMGPVFVETNQNSLAIIDFNFNAWGYQSFPLDSDTKTEEMYDERVGELLNIPVISSPMISEGGNREVNGKGALMVTEVVEKGQARYRRASGFVLEFEQ